MFFSNTDLNDKNFVLDSMSVEVAANYHQCLLSYPRIKTYLVKTLGIDELSLSTYNIGYCDTAVFEHSLFKGCITLPLVYIDNTVELFGLKIGPTENHNIDFAFNPFYQPIFTLDALDNVAIKCDSPLDVIAFNEHGYKNTFCEFGSCLSETTIDELKQMGTSTIVYFTSVLGVRFGIAEAAYIAQRYGITLCEVNLPFLTRHIGEWDTFQWQLFDKRLTCALSHIGMRNERYQA
jgi:hypothetical protein